MYRKISTESAGGTGWRRKKFVLKGTIVLLFLVFGGIFSGCGQGDSNAPGVRHDSSGSTQKMTVERLREAADVQIPSGVTPVQMTHHEQKHSVVLDGVFSVSRSFEDLVDFYRSSLEQAPLFERNGRVQFILDDNPRTPVHLYMERYDPSRKHHLGGKRVGELEVKAGTVLLRITARTRDFHP